MAFNLTNTTLKEAVISYTKRSDKDFVDNIPLFKAMAERRIAIDLKITGLQVSVQGPPNLVPGYPIISKPTRWRADASFNIGIGATFQRKKVLYHRTYEFCRSYWPDETKVGEPKYYCSTYNYDSYFFVPTPELAYPYEALFWETPQLLDDVAQVNFLSTGIPRLLLLGTLLETAPFLQDDPRLPMWEQEYQSEKASVAAEETLRTLGVVAPQSGGV